jgi:o-succinylbenzoate synthase
MTLFSSYTIKELVFKKPARTSRGEMLTHTVYIIRLQDGNRVGYGEAAPLKGLSIDDRPDFETKLKECCLFINDGCPVDVLDLSAFPSLKFAFETAILSLRFDSAFKVFDTSFFTGTPIDINGLVWMNTKAEMLEEAFDKAEQGFDCIKFKVGALDFDEECRMLELFRRRYSAFKITLRLDANGASSTDDALEKLKELSRFEIHSIEQPIKAKQEDWMQELCAKTPIHIALDEELIGIDVVNDGLALLKKIKPQYIILKPTLIGGFGNSDTWIKHARQKNIGWWATSALESNIGLNAIAQWCSTYENPLPQGLGTGALYTNNIQSPLVISKGKLQLDSDHSWGEAFSSDPSF